MPLAFAPPGVQARARAKVRAEPRRKALGGHQMLDEHAAAKRRPPGPLRRAAPKTLHALSHVASVPALDKPRGSVSNNAVACGECGLLVPAKSLTRHLADECELRLVVCSRPECGAEFAAYERRAHERGGCVRAQRRREMLEHAGSRDLAICERCKQPLGRSSSQRKAHQQTCPVRAVKCPNASAGCDKIVLAVLMKQHLSEECDVAARRAQLANRFRASDSERVPCPDCAQQVTRRFLVRHQEQDCPHRLVECALNCGTKDIRLSEMRDHLRHDCELYFHRMNLVERREKRQATAPTCKYRCGAKLCESTMTLHYKSQCPKRPIQCVCGATIRARDREAHAKGTLQYAKGSVSRCPLAARREDLAALSAARGRKPVRIRCPNNCGALVRQYRMREHVEEACPKRLMACKYAGTGCNLGGRLLSGDDMAEHLEEDCPGAARHRQQVRRGEATQHARLSCPNGCGAELRRAEIKVHCEVLCSHRLVPCVLHCGDVVPLAAMEDHKRDDCKAARERERLVWLARRRHRMKAGLPVDLGERFPGDPETDGGADGEGGEEGEEEEEEEEEEDYW